jgi:GAF domain-containing protein
MAGDRYSQIEALIGQEPHLGADGAGMTGGMRRLCTAAGRALAARGVGLSVMADDGLRGLSAASDEDTARLEELQFTYGEGPCIDAFDSRRPVLISDLGGALRRWPACGSAMFDHGVRAVFAFPLQIGAARLGMLDVFRDRPGTLLPGELTTALTFAEVAVATLVDGLGPSPSGEPAPGWLADPLGPRAQLFQAQGMVMVQLRVPLAIAMARMRAYAFAHNLRLSEVAAAVIARQIVFEQDMP